MKLFSCAFEAKDGWYGNRFSEMKQSETLDREELLTLIIYLRIKFIYLSMKFIYNLCLLI